MTGGSGTIGGYVLRELLGAGHAATCFSRTAPQVKGATFLTGDITKPDQVSGACQGYDAIIHLAAVPGPRRVTPERLMYVNVVGTVNILEAAVKSGIGRVVLASSGAATGFSFQKREVVPKYLPIDEEHPSEPQDEYGLSKLLAEVTCKSYTHAYGIQTICLRINNNWYVSRKEAEVAVRSGWAKGLTVDELWSQRYLKTVQDAEEEWPVPGPPSPRNILWAFTDARDAAQAFRLAVENEDIEHEILLISGDDTCSSVETRELVSRHYPDVPLKAPLEGYATLFSHEMASRMLGYRPRYTWRASDFRVWMDSRNG